MSGDLIGVRFSWVFLDNAKFVPAWELARDPEIAKAGVLLSGTPLPLPAPAWLSAWTTVTPARHTLLDAYVARTSGDLHAHAALLDMVTDDDRTVRIDRALLLAACHIDGGSAARGRSPAGARRAEHRATRGQAPTATRRSRHVFAWSSTRRQSASSCGCCHDQPMVAGLLEQRHFRVLRAAGRQPAMESHDRPRRVKA